MKNNKISNIFKSALAAGTVFGGSNMFNNMDMVYAAPELEQDNETEVEIVLPSEETSEEEYYEIDNDVDESSTEQTDNSTDESSTEQGGAEQTEIGRAHV